MCRNLRLNAAIDRGFDEAMVEHLDDPVRSGLPERQQVVLRLTRAFLTAPETFYDADWDELRTHYTEEQIAELILDLVRFRPGSKLMVGAGFEPEGDQLIYA